MSEAEKIDLNSPEYYLNRELSLLSFQWRVLEEAQDERNPLLERAKFLAIVESNLSEFFMVRVGGLSMQRDAGVVDLSPDGRTPAEQLVEIRKEAQRLLQEMRNYWKSVLLPELSKAGIYILDYNELNARQKEIADEYFHEVIFPVLTPLAVDPGHPFPHISNLSLNLAVSIRDPQGHTHFARLKVPPALQQLLPLKRSSGGVRKDGTVPHDHYFVWIEQVITANLKWLFPGMEILEAHPFHVTRNADMAIQELEALDLLETIEQGLRRRRFGDVVRVMVNEDMPASIKNVLLENLKVDRNEVYSLRGPLDLTCLMQLTKIDRYDLRDHPFTPAIPSCLKIHPDSEDGAIFSAISQENILLHHPYDSFTPVVEFLKSAARDPDVLAIKQTLYRVGTNAPVVETLLQASRDYGKQVAVLVELKARFDEESNIGWARRLEQEGAHVTYGFPGLKTHAKIALVVRREGERIRRYIHLATGNYNYATAQVYEDLGWFTCDEEIGADATDLFNYLTGYSAIQDFRKLLVAPINLRQRFEEMIRREIRHQQEGRQGHLIFKMNSLADISIIQLLYQASQAGVKVDLIVRGVCMLRPGVKGLSENIRVISVLGRFLEHSRVYYFHNGGQEQVFLGSADLMPRNINQRVEVLFSIEDQRMIRQLRDDILEAYLRDNTRARCMKSDGSYERMQPGEPLLNAQEWFLAQARRSMEG